LLGVSNLPEIVSLGDEMPGVKSSGDELISVEVHLDELDERIEAMLRLIDATHGKDIQTGELNSGHDVSKETRGLVIVLLYASYENLLTGLNRTLLEGAVKCRVSNRRLRPGIRMFALSSAVDSLRKVSERKVYKEKLPELIELTASTQRPCSIDLEKIRFPTDGSFFKQSQIELWCEIFSIPNPEDLLSRVWGHIDAVVENRNAIAHGRRTAGQVGRQYTERDIRSLVNDWHHDWSQFLCEVGKIASSKDFFILPR